jgi:hypothetical protein
MPRSRSTQRRSQGGALFGPLNTIPMHAGRDRHRRSPMPMITIVEVSRRLLLRHAGSQ